MHSESTTGQQKRVFFLNGNKDEREWRADGNRQKPGKMEETGAAEKMVGGFGILA